MSYGGLASPARAMRFHAPYFNLYGGNLRLFPA